MQMLPPEVLVMILDLIDVDLEKPELRNLRRTCRTLASLAAPYLFREVSIWLERDSLQKLVGYSEHPLYSQCITHITVATDRLNPYIYNKEPMLHSGPPNPWNAPNIKILYQWANATRDEKFAGCNPTESARAKRLVEHLEYQKRMEKEELDVVLLSKAMKKLPRLAHVVFDSKNSPPESAQLSREGFHIVDSKSAWPRHVLQTGLKALADAGCRPQSLLIINGFLKDHYTPSWAFDDLELMIPKAKLSALVQNLRFFCFAGTTEMQYWDENSLHEGAVGHFLENAHQLEQVALNVSGEIRGDTVRPLLGYTQYRNLRVISLYDMLSREEDLSSWLLMHSDSLEIIRLTGITLFRGEWVSFLDTMRLKSWPRLSSLSLCEVLEDNSEGGIFSMDWTHGASPLLDYIQKKSDTNPYHVYHPGWFPELFGSSTESE